MTMKYVKVIDRGKTYPSICNNDSKRYFFENPDYIEGALPTNGESYYLVKIYDYKQFEDSSVQRIAKIRSPIHGEEYLIDVEGISGLNYSEYKGLDSKTRIELDLKLRSYMNSVPMPDKLISKLARPKQPQIMAPKSVIGNDSFSVGDEVVVTYSSSPYFNTTMRVCAKDQAGYPYLLSKLDSKTPMVGVYGDQIRHNDPNEALSFSRNELLVILNQTKSADEIILDLMDHVTN